MTMRRRELRLALAMRGGVSLAVWIGGAVQEIDRLRVGLHSGSGNALVDLARAVGYGSVEVDVLSGASAGGLNGAVYATAMTEGHSIEPLRDVWMDDADLERLLLAPGSRTLSVLDGDFFHRRLHEQFTDLHEREGPVPKAENLELLLSVSSVVPYPIATRVDPTVSEQRIDGQIRLRFRRAVDLGRYGLPRGLPSLGVSPADAALAARSTAAFPVAFEPRRIEATDLAGRLEFEPGRPTPTLLYDGGVVDNMPVGKALRAIDDAPADGPTQRYLVYLHPSPGMPDPGSADRWARTLEDLTRRVRPLDVLASASKSRRSKSLVEDLEALDDHNERVQRDLRVRASLLRRTGPAPVSAEEVARLDAERLVDLLRFPRSHLHHLSEPFDPTPVVTDGDGRSVATIQRVLQARLIADAVPRDALPTMVGYSWRPWSAIIRILSRLIEWALDLEAADEDGTAEAVGGVKEELYHLRAYAYSRACELNRDTLRGLPAPDQLPEGATALAGLVADVRGPLVREHLPEITVVWDRLTVAAGRLRRTAEDVGAVGAVAAGADAVDEPTVGDPLTPLARALVDLIPLDGEPGRVQAALDRIDCLLLTQHQHAPSGSLATVRYQTMSGTANTPLASTYRWPANAPEALRDDPPSLFRSLRLAPEVAGETHSPEGLCHPGSKLAGNQLHNFAAFIEAHWRANDWMWGQADAAATLVDLLLGREPGGEPLATEGARPPTPSAAQIEAICTGPTGDPELDGIARLPWTAGVADAVERELADPGRNLDLTRALVLWRRHLEIFAVELGRQADEVNPVGAPPADGLEATIAAWDRSPRRLSASWGSRRSASLGNRAGFLAWRTLFAGTGPALRAARHLLAPVVAALVAFLLGRRMTLFATLLFLTGAVLPRTHDDAAGQVAVAALAGCLGIGGLALTRRPRQALGAVDVGDDPEERPWRLGEPWAVLALLTTVACVGGAVLISRSPLAELRSDGDLYLWLVAGVTAVATGLTWFWVRWYWWIPVTALSTALITGWAWMGRNPAEVETWRAVGRPLSAVGSFWFALLVVAVATTAIATVFDVGSRHRRPG